MSLCVAGQQSTSTVQGLSLWSGSRDITEHRVEKTHRQLVDSLALNHHWKQDTSRLKIKSNKKLAYSPAQLHVHNTSHSCSSAATPRPRIYFLI